VPAGFDPYAPGFLASPFAAYRRLHEAGEVLWHPPLGMWIVPGHAAVRAALRDPSLLALSIAEKLQGLGRRSGRDFPALREVLDTVPFLVNPPAHAALRRFVAGVLTTQAISRWVPAMREIAARLLAPLRGAEGFDAVTDYADRLPPLFMARLLGVPEDGVPQLLGYTTGVIAVFNRTLRMREYERLESKTAAALAYLLELARARRAHPQDDAISGMLAARYDGRPLDEAHVARLALMLFLVGVETTSTLIGSSIRMLADHPEQQAALRRDPALLKAAVEEVLRSEAPVQQGLRLVTEARELGGQSLERGERVMVVYCAANRDPHVYSEPDRFEPRREGPPHLAFSEGAHVCLGATLSRTETQVALEALFELPPLARSAGAESWWPYDWMRRLRTLPVKFA